MTRPIAAALLIAVTLTGGAADARARPSTDEIRRMRRCDVMTHARAMRDRDCVRLMRDHRGMQQHGVRMMKRNGGGPR